MAICQREGGSAARISLDLFPLHVGQTDKHYQQCSCKDSFIKREEKVLSECAWPLSIFSDFFVFQRKKLYNWSPSSSPPSFTLIFKSRISTVSLSHTSSHILCQMQSRSLTSASSVASHVLRDIV
jgi:hypothetical protein